MKKILRCSLTVILILLLVSVTGTLFAASVGDYHYTFSGTITHVDRGHGNLNFTDINVGDPLSGEVFFTLTTTETADPNYNIIQAWTGHHTNNVKVHDYNVSISDIISVDAHSYDPILGGFNDFQNGIDSYYSMNLSPDGADTLDKYTMSLLVYYLNDDKNGIFVLEAPDPNFDGNKGKLTAAYSVQVVEAVPIPSTIFLLGMGILGLVGVIRGKKSIGQEE